MTNILMHLESFQHNEIYKGKAGVVGLTAHFRCQLWVAFAEFHALTQFATTLSNSTFPSFFLSYNSKINFKNFRWLLKFSNNDTGKIKPLISWQWPQQMLQNIWPEDKVFSYQLKGALKVVQAKQITTTNQGLYFFSMKCMLYIKLCIPLLAFLSKFLWSQCIFSEQRFKMHNTPPINV